MPEKTVNVKMNPAKGKRLSIEDGDTIYSFNHATVIEIPEELYLANQHRLLKANVKKPKADDAVKKPEAKKNEDSE